MMTNEEFAQYLLQFQALAMGELEPAAEDLDELMEVNLLGFDVGYCQCLVGETLVEVRHLADIHSFELKIEVMEIPEAWVADFCQVAMAQSTAASHYQGITWTLQEQAQVVAHVLVPLAHFNAGHDFGDFLQDVSDDLADECLELCMQVQMQQVKKAQAEQTGAAETGRVSGTAGAVDANAAPGQAGTGPQAPGGDVTGGATPDGAHKSVLHLRV
jgi:hypothetical protein